MAYKDARAELDLGGGEAVIIGDPATNKTEGPCASVRPVRRVATRAR